MDKISFDSVKKWRYSQTIKLPAAIGGFCPHCSEKVVFSLSNDTNDTARKAMALSSLCPSCDMPVSIWVIRNDAVPKNRDIDPVAIYMYPPLKDYYCGSDYEAHIPEPLFRAYKSTIDSLNAKNYTATAVGSRRTLEGIFKYLLPEQQRSQTLYKLIESVEQTINLSEPLSKLSNAIRQGGNMGAHFDSEKEPDGIMAKQMVELLDYLISYLHVLPKNIQELEDELNK